MIRTMVATALALLLAGLVWAGSDMAANSEPVALELLGDSGGLISLRGGEVGLHQQRRVAQQLVLPRAQRHLALDEAAHDADVLGPADGVAAHEAVAKKGEPKMVLAFNAFESDEAVPAQPKRKAIRKVAAGGRYIDPELADRMVFEVGLTDSRPLHSLLSEREFSVFERLAQGANVNDIAQQLALSNKTISTHKARLMQKLNITSLAELVKYAMEHKLL